MEELTACPLRVPRGECTAATGCMSFELGAAYAFDSMTNHSILGCQQQNLTGVGRKCVIGMPGLSRNGSAHDQTVDAKAAPFLSEAGNTQPCVSTCGGSETDDANVSRDRKHQIWIQMTGNGYTRR